MPLLTIDIDESLSRKLDETAAATGTESAEAMIARLLPFWLEDHATFCALVEEGQADFRAGRHSDGDSFFAELEAKYTAMAKAQERTAAE